MITVDVETPLVLGPEHAGISMTPREFDAIEEWDENYVYELINGVLVVSPPAAESERMPNDELGFLLRLYKHQHPEGAALDDTGFEQYIRTANRRRADRVIWAGLGRQPNPRKDKPTIVVEFVSPGKRSWRRDYLDKRKEYLAAGVAEYWIIDRFQRTLTVYRRRAKEQVVRESESYSTPLLPGFELPLGHLLDVADRWHAASTGRKSRRSSGS